MPYPTCDGVCRRCWRAEHLEETVSFCGRVLTASELNLVRQIIADFPRLSQAELAYTICELLEWRRPNGKLKNPECVEWLQKWQQQALPGLPELRVTKPRATHRLLATDPQSDPPLPLHGRLADYQPLRLLGRGASLGQPHSVFGRSSTPHRLAGRLWCAPPAVGDPGGPALHRDLLPSRQLDLGGPDSGPRPHGSHP